MCTFSQETIEKVVAFHGHSCPGLAIGIRAAEFAAKELPGCSPAGLVCVTETDMCGVDAIQYLTGCTFGKGNLIHRDYGKMAFSFYNRESGKAFRLLLRTSAREKEHDELARLMQKSSLGIATGEEQDKLAGLRKSFQDYYLTESLENLFEKTEQPVLPPRPARVLESLTCDGCSEKTMESRTRRFGGQTLCIPCFGKVEQKISPEILPQQSEKGRGREKDKAGD